MEESQASTLYILTPIYLIYWQAYLYVLCLQTSSQGGNAWQNVLLHKWSFSLKEVDFDFLVPGVDE